VVPLWGWHGVVMRMRRGTTGCARPCGMPSANAEQARRLAGMSSLQSRHMVAANKVGYREAQRSTLPPITR
jgi:hypothetical protein